MGESLHRVLGYGALLDAGHVATLCGREHLHSFEIVTLRGWRRHWQVRYRNGCWAGGAYHDRETGALQPGGVAFLGVRPAPGVTMRVSLCTVDDPGLAAIDAEEYLYAREDATAGVDVVGSAPLWLYRERRELFTAGWYDGEDVVVSRDYHDRVTRAAQRLGGPSFDATTDLCPWPVVDLEWRAG